MKTIEIITSEEWNWYKAGQQFNVRDETKYSNIGIQVFADGPDVVQHGHYKFV
ncbi:MAG: hypothetical protein ACQEXX_01235 [Bacillota bacterium]